MCNGSLGRVKRKRAVRHGKNLLIQIILRMRKVLSGLLLSIHTSCSIQVLLLADAHAGQTLPAYA